MILYGDFHIHTALSPCGDIEMSPNNIINMAILKGLDVIAITDHNSIENAAVCMEAGRINGITVIPGMELQTKEDVHVICLFNNINDAWTFQEYVYKHLPNLKNNEKVFGEQLQYDANDNIIGKNERLLLTSANISFDDAFNEVSRLGGAFIPAHIDKNANGIISNLGFIPSYLDIKTVEYKSLDNIKKYIKSGILSSSYNFIKSSDAHYLGDILERETTLECEANDINSVIKKLK